MNYFIKMYNCSFKFQPYNTHSFSHGFISALSISLVSELCDKTFFIAAIMAMRHSRIIVFSGAVLALIVMTILSSVIGVLATNIPRKFVVYMSTILFFIFGAKMLHEWYLMSPNDSQEEYNEVQKEILKKEQQFLTNCNPKIDSIKEGRTNYLNKPIFPFSFNLNMLLPTICKNTELLKLIYTVGVQAFTLSFLAEWGDRSQITTIILAAKEDVYGVAFGTIIGQSICTMLAVIAGRYISTKLSIRLVTLIGGLFFILFGFTTLLFDNKTMVTDSVNHFGS